jgi:hypothetical protein
MPISDSNSLCYHISYTNLSSNSLTRALWFQVHGAGALELGFRATFLMRFLIKLTPASYPGIWQSVFYIFVGSHFTFLSYPYKLPTQVFWNP